MFIEKLVVEAGVMILLRRHFVFIEKLVVEAGVMILLRKPTLTSRELLRWTLGWTTLKARRHNAMLCQVHRCCTNQAPPYLCSKFAPNSNLNYI